MFRKKKNTQPQIPRCFLSFESVWTCSGTHEGWDFPSRTGHKMVAQTPRARNSVPHGCGGKLCNSTPISSPRKWSDTSGMAC